MQREKRNKILKFSAFIAAALVIIILLSQMDRIVRKIGIGGKGAIDNYNDMKTVYLNGEAFLPKKNIITFLVIGLDDFGKVQSSGSYNNTAQADFLMLCIIDKENEKYSFIHINRDTMTSVDILGVTGVKAGEDTMQIALSHTYGNGLSKSCDNTVRAVSRLLYGINIDFYLSMNMDAISSFTDYIGGVPIVIEEDLTIIDESFVKGASVNLTGPLALNFIRARSSLPDSTNIARMNRQKQFLNAFVDKIKKTEITDSFLDGAYSSIKDYSVTNCDIFMLDTLVDYINAYSFGGIISPDGEAVKGAEFMEFYVDQQDLQKIASELLYEKR